MCNFLQVFALKPARTAANREQHFPSSSFYRCIMLSSLKSVPQANEFPMELTNLKDPLHMWQRLIAYLGLDDKKVIVAMRRTSETLLRDASDFVVGAYDYLASFDETASILGWEQKMDEAHLEERRQFFATWMARAIGVDLSDEFALYLFDAGLLHAAHGPRQTHTPPQWVMGAIAMVQAHFAERILHYGHDRELAATAIGGWNKYLMLQNYQMMAGYDVARELDRGSIDVIVKLYGKLQVLAGREEQQVHCYNGSTLADVLRKFFNYHPLLRQEVFEVAWRSPEGDVEATWATDFEKVYVPRQGPYWRILLNGQEVRYQGGFEQPIKAGDIVALFPPGR
jgi:molybdopterin converting factor small subunit